MNAAGYRNLINSSPLSLEQKMSWHCAIGANFVIPQQMAPFFTQVTLWAKLGYSLEAKFQLPTGTIGGSTQATAWEVIKTFDLIDYC
jgi:hypothetical protein